MYIFMTSCTANHSCVYIHKAMQSTRRARDEFQMRATCGYSTRLKFLISCLNITEFMHLVYIYIYMHGCSKAPPRGTYPMYHSEDLEVAQ